MECRIVDMTRRCPPDELKLMFARRQVHHGDQTRLVAPSAAFGRAFLGNFRRCALAIDRL
jgi:hypothetical protein